MEADMKDICERKKDLQQVISYNVEQYKNALIKASQMSSKLRDVNKRKERKERKRKKKKEKKRSTKHNK